MNRPDSGLRRGRLRLVMNSLVLAFAVIPVVVLAQDPQAGYSQAGDPQQSAGSSHAIAAVAVSQEADPKADTPKQIALTDETKFERSEAPVFRYLLLPKKSKWFKALAKRWAIVDVKEREKAIVENFDKQIADRKKQNEADPQIASLEERKRRFLRDFTNLAFLMEVRGDSDQSVRIQVTPTTTDKKAEDFAVGIKNQVSKWSGYKISRDEANQTKGERRGEFTATRSSLSALQRGGRALGFGSTPCSSWQARTERPPSRSFTSIGLPFRR